MVTNLLGTFSVYLCKEANWCLYIIRIKPLEFPTHTLELPQPNQASSLVYSQLFSSSHHTVTSSDDVVSPLWSDEPQPLGIRREDHRRIHMVRLTSIDRRLVLFNTIYNLLILHFVCLCFQGRWFWFGREKQSKGTYTFVLVHHAPKYKHLRSFWLLLHVVIFRLCLGLCQTHQSYPSGTTTVRAQNKLQGRTVKWCCSMYFTLDHEFHYLVLLFFICSSEPILTFYCLLDQSPGYFQGPVQKREQYPGKCIMLIPVGTYHIGNRSEVILVFCGENRWYAIAIHQLESRSLPIEGLLLPRYSITLLLPPKSLGIYPPFYPKYFFTTWL